MSLPILTATTAAASLYAAALHRHPGYEPKWTWATVAGGNALIGAGLALWLWRSPLPASRRAGPAAFGRFVAVTLAAGLPIILWQVGLHHVLPALRKAD